MMKNRKNGFTLIELLVVISLIGVLSIASGIGLTKVLKGNTKKEYQESYNKIFEAIHICSKMSSCKSIFEGTPTINNLISAGLLDESIKNAVNGICKKDDSSGNYIKFTGYETISITSNVATVCTLKSDNTTAATVSENVESDWNSQNCS